MPKYTVTVTFSPETFEFDTDKYHDVDDGVENFHPDDLDSVLEYIEEQDIVNEEVDICSVEIAEVKAELAK